MAPACGDSCAHCRHWQIGTLDAQTRFTASVAGTAYLCHVSRSDTAGCDSCKYFDKARLTA